MTSIAVSSDGNAFFDIVEAVYISQNNVVSNNKLLCDTEISESMARL